MLTALSQHQPLLWVHGSYAQQTTLLPLPIQHPHKVIATVQVCHTVAPNQQLIAVCPESHPNQIMVERQRLFENETQLLKSLLQRFHHNAAFQQQLAAFNTPSTKINHAITVDWANRIAQLMRQHGIQLPYRGFDTSQSQMSAIQRILPIIQAGLHYGQSESAIMRVINHLHNLQSLLRFSDRYLETDVDCRLANTFHRLYPEADHDEFSRTIIQITLLILRIDPSLAQQLRQQL